MLNSVCWDTDYNGLDFRTRRGCPLRASHDGYVKLERSSDGGLGVEIYDYDNGFKTLDYHMLSFSVVDKQFIKQGDLMGTADNTGQFTTGDHDHFHMKLIDKQGNTLNKDNGYNGAIDPRPYFPIGWENSNALNRYGKEKTSFIRKYIALRRFHNPEQMYAYLYGGWSIEDCLNDGMRENYAYLTYDEYKQGKKPFTI